MTCAEEKKTLIDDNIYILNGYENISNSSYYTHGFWGVFLLLDNDGGFRGKFSGFHLELERGAYMLVYFNF